MSVLVKFHQYLCRFESGSSVAEASRAQFSTVMVNLTIW